MDDAKSQWVDELEQRVEDRFVKLIAPLLKEDERRVTRLVADIQEYDLFPPAECMDDKMWKRRGMVYEAEDKFMSTILLKGKEVPDWLYGFISHQNTTCLPENGTADECKDGILAVMEESAASVVKRVGETLGVYSINIITVEIDLLAEHITLHCVTEKPVMQVNTIMGNQVIRKAMPSRARVCVNTHVEECRRTDEYLKQRPSRQEISREFFYEDGAIVRAEPVHWSAGSTYEPGDILRVGTIVHRIERDAAAQRWSDIAHDGDPIAGRDDRRRLQDGTPFKPRERAYWNAARNR